MILRFMEYILKSVIQVYTIASMLLVRFYVRGKWTGFSNAVIQLGKTTFEDLSGGESYFRVCYQEPRGAGG